MSHAPRYAIIMAGGAGTRFWPRSRAHTPKQLLALRGGRSLLQDTVARVAPPIARAHVLIVTGRAHARAVARQLPRVRMLVEPEGRNTAAAIALAALHVARREPGAVLAVLPADHVIGDLPAFRRDLRIALGVAERSGALVTIGVAPTHAETGYGYIRLGASLPGARGRAAWVAEFIEKPTRPRAERLIAEGGVLWNSGMFVWRADAILAALRAHLPEVIGPLEAAGRSPRALAAAYRRLPAVSIDYGVLERARRVVVVRGRFAWSDVGSWAAVATLWSGGNGRNALRGRAVSIDSHGCLIDSPDRLVAVLGVNDLVVVDTPDAILVCRKDRAQDVRLVVDEIRRRGLRRYL